MKLNSFILSVSRSSSSIYRILVAFILPNCGLVSINEPTDDADDDHIQIVGLQQIHLLDWIDKR